MTTGNFSLITHTLTGTQQQVFDFTGSLSTITSWMLGISGCDWQVSIGAGNPQNYGVTFTVQHSPGTLTISVTPVLPPNFSGSSETTVTVLATSLPLSQVALSNNAPAPIGTTVSAGAASLPAVSAAAALAGLTLSFQGGSSNFLLTDIGCGVGVSVVPTAAGQSLSAPGVPTPYAYGALAGMAPIDPVHSIIASGTITCYENSQSLGLGIAQVSLPFSGDVVFPNGFTPNQTAALLVGFGFQFIGDDGVQWSQLQITPTLNTDANSNASSVGGTITMGISGTKPSVQGPIYGDTKVGTALIIGVNTAIG